MKQQSKQFALLCVLFFSISFLIGYLYIGQYDVIVDRRGHQIVKWREWEKKFITPSPKPIKLK